MVFCFGLNKKIKVSKNLSGDEIPIKWKDPKDPYAVTYLSVLVGFSQLANSQKQGFVVSAVIEVFVKDASDGLFDGKESGNPLSLPNRQASNSSSLYSSFNSRYLNFSPRRWKTGNYI
jgi:hypothetical protein